jgi:hypothetical protein
MRASLLPVCGLLLACAPEHEPRGYASRPATGSPAPVQAIAVPPPPFTDGIFPCQDCHANLDVDLTRRPLEEHTEIALDHGDRDRWCFDCHNPEDRDVLRLVGGRLIPFSESYLLCGQCHGDKLRDWRVGVHGKRTGSWRDEKQYLLCAHCHDPHAPRFPPLAPLPPPRRPAEILRGTP